MYKNTYWNHEILKMKKMWWKIDHNKTHTAASTFLSSCLHHNKNMQSENRLQNKYLLPSPMISCQYEKYNHLNHVILKKNSHILMFPFKCLNPHNPAPMKYVVWQQTMKQIIPPLPHAFMPVWIIQWTKHFESRSGILYLWSILVAFYKWSQKNGLYNIFYGRLENTNKILNVIITYYFIHVCIF